MLKINRPEHKKAVTFKMTQETRERLEEIAKKYECGSGLALEAIINDVWEREINGKKDG